MNLFLKILNLVFKAFVFFSTYIFVLFKVDKRVKAGKYFKNIFSEGYLITFLYMFSLKWINKTGRVIPTNITCTISGLDERIKFHPNDFHNFISPGCYFQTLGGEIHIGSNTFIGPNVGIITANHDLNNIQSHASGLDVKIGSNCWIGMNSVILPGVCLGDNTIVAAGSVVNSSFKEGYVLVAGSPAKLKRSL